MSRRLFSSRITESGKFLKTPPSSQALYFHLNMHADDDGIVEAYKVMKLTGSNEGDLKALVEGGFIIILNSDLVTYIPHWLEHNTIRADRKIDSIYIDLLIKVVPEVDMLKSRPRADTQQGRLILGLNTGLSMDGTRTVHGRREVKLSKDKLRQDNPLPPELSFECFYEKYPKHISRQTAKKSWDRINPSEDLARTIFQRLEVHKQSEQWVKDRGQFIPHPATWLNQRRWEDEVRPAVTSNSTIEIL